jgi:hypothetical protein
MTTNISSQILEKASESLEIPPSAYEKTEKRYRSLGEWFQRPESNCARNKPQIYPQGSFRLGTVIRPLSDDESYDLDLGCRLSEGITRTSHTQKQLKQIVGDELEAYRKAQNFSQKLEEKHRCWRLFYADELSFHLDAVPSIPADTSQKQFIKTAMLNEGIIEQGLASNITDKAGAITDNRQPNYNVRSDDWRISNSEGYALWFESRMRLARTLLEWMAKSAGVSSIDKLPAYKWKTPLQRCVQLLKRHRDSMFKDAPDSKPISIIITTLAGHAYSGEVNLDEALTNILNKMDSFIRTSSPKVPNPVNPNEDFADKWTEPKYAHLRLSESFYNWLRQARIDFKNIASSRDAARLSLLLDGKLMVKMGAATINEQIPLGAPAITSTPKIHDISNTPARPWLAS